MDEKLINESADKIVKLFKEKEIDLPKKSIVDDLTKLVDEKFDFALPMNDAIRAVVGKYSRQHNVKIMISGGSGSGDTQPIKDLVANTWVTVEGEVVEINKPDSKKIHQTAIITDGSGSIRVTVWNRNPDEPHVTDMVVGKWYKISNGIVNIYNNIPAIGVQKTSIITKIDGKAKLTPTVTKIIDIKPGIVNLQAKVVKLFEPKSDKVAQAGIIGDNTGTIRFVIWKSTKPKKQLKEGQVYDIPFAACNLFNNTLSVNLIPDETKDLKIDIDVKTTTLSTLGNLVNVQEGSGIVKRCVIEGCHRVLNRMNYCTIHEIQKDYKYDMRIKGVIDTGYDAKFIHIPLKQTEELIGMTLEQAIKKSEHDSLGVDAIYMEIKNKIVGKYFIVEGNEMNDRILVSGIKPATLEDMKKLTELDFKNSPQSTLGDAS